jgi:carboxymethylenebutenolidase
MCYDTDAAPPVYGAPVTDTSSSSLVLTSSDGTGFAAYLSEPAESHGTGVLVLPDNRGLSGFYEQLTVRLAEQGYPALAVDYFGRTAGVGYRGADFDHMSHLFQLTRPGLYADIAAGIAHLTGPVGVRTTVCLGFCFGGRLAFLTAAPSFGLAGVIGLYGMPGMLNGAPGPTQLAGELRAPVLGLFGGADEGIGPELVTEFEQALAQAGVPHEIVTYPGAPHSFFELNRPEYASAQADAWRRILAFVRLGALSR